MRLWNSDSLGLSDDKMSRWAEGHHSEPFYDCTPLVVRYPQAQLIKNPLAKKKPPIELKVSVYVFTLC